MQIKLEKTFPINSSEADAWILLQDISGVARCMPGAEITEEVDETHYKGTVNTKVGPAKMSFNGDIEVMELDTLKHEMHLLGKGQDQKGNSTAEMDLTATVVKKDDTHSELHGVATVTVNGRIASLGGRMMNQVADQILNQFGQNFTDTVDSLKDQKSETAKAEAVSNTSTKELNAFSFAWKVLVGFFKSLFERKDVHTS